MQNRLATLLAITLFIGMLIYACQPNVSVQTAQYAVNGQKLYTTHCQNCHGAKGEGLGKLYPPLTDTSYLSQQRDKLACIVKYGINEPLEIHGQRYEEQMPGVTQLSDIEIAYILTYVTTRFGKDTHSYTLEEVQKGLKACK